MANILIIPSGGDIYFDTGSAGSSTVANLSGSGVLLGHDGASALVITSYNTGDLDRFAVDGYNGRLFSVTDEVTGDIFSVNDAAGLPIINVYSASEDIVTIGEFGSDALVISGNSGIGMFTGVPSEALHVNGNIAVEGTVDGRDVAADGAVLDSISSSTGNYVDLTTNQNINGDKTFSGQVEATGQAASTDNSVMTKGLVRDFSSVWGDVYKSSNGETDTNNKLSVIDRGDRYFHFTCWTGTAAGDGQWTDFMPQTFGLTNGSGAKGQLRDTFSYKFKFDSNTVTSTDVDLWLIRGKTANATLPVASDVCFALKFAGEEDLMIAVYDGVTAHTTTIDVSTIESNFTNLGTQQEFMWTWDGTTAKVYGRYRKPAGTGDNDWSIWYTIGSLTPSGMSASTTSLSHGGLHFLQHTPVTCTAYTKSYIIWDLKHTSHVIAPN